MEKASLNLIKEVKKQSRENRYLLFLDNVKIVKDGIKSKYFKPIISFTSDENLQLDLNCKIYLTSYKTIESLVDTKTPQNVCVMLEYIPHMVEKPKTNFLVLDKIQDPGNAGTLIRTAKATGFDYVFMLDCVKLTNSKLIRSSVGGIFGLEIFEMTKNDFIPYQKEWNFPLIMADMDGENVFKAEIKQQVGVVVGNEGKGVSDEIAKLCTKTLSIPMKEGIESLNAGVSGSIIMYQINKDSLK